MAEENSKLHNKISELKKKLDESEKQIVELQKEIDDLKIENAELKANSLQENPEKSVAIKQMNRTHEEEKFSSGELNAQMDTNRAKKSEQSSMLVPNWLVEVLEWIERIEMANRSLSFASRLFKELCWPKLHLNVKKRSIEKLKIAAEQDKESFAVRAIMHHYRYSRKCRYSAPIAGTKLPEYITYIEELHICFLDVHVFEFVQNILPLLNNITVKFNGKINDWEDDNIRIRPIRYLLKILATKTIELDIYDYSTPVNLCHFNNLFPGFIDGIQKLTLKFSKSTQWDSFFNWLNVEQKDGKPKIVGLHFHAFNEVYGGFGAGCTENEVPKNFIERVKKEFFRSTLPTTFLIQLHRSLPNFMLENKNTGELLALYPNPDPRSWGGPFLTRHRIGMEHLRANWEKHFNWETRIAIENMEIGNFNLPKQMLPSASERSQIFQHNCDGCGGIHENNVDPM